LDQGFMGDGTGYNLRAIGRVLGDLADIGYDAQWHGLRAADIGAPHGRFRVFILATNTRSRTGRVVTDERGIQRSGPDDLQAATNTTNSGQRIRAIDDVPKHTGATGVRSGIASASRGVSRTTSGTAWGAYEPAIRRW